MPRDFVTVVSGLPRSGTSMLMRMLEAGGVPAITDGQRRADPDNPLGYFELEAVKNLPDDVDWVADAPGKAVKVVSALLEKLPKTAQYRVIFIERDLKEVLASQGRMLERRGNLPESGGDHVMAPLFRKHIESVLTRARARRDMQLLLVAHADALASPADVAARLDEFLGGELDVAAMAAAVDESLWRQRASVPSSGG